jgi:hypothetical protein
MIARAATGAVACEEFRSLLDDAKLRECWTRHLVAVDRGLYANIRHSGDVLLVVNNGKVALNRLDMTPRP